MKKCLVVDDDITRLYYFWKNINKSAEMHPAPDYDKAIELLKSDNFNIIFLDYDLGKCDKNGADIAKWLIENNKNKESLIVLHSMSEEGKKEIRKILPDSMIATGVWLNPELLKECISVC